MSPWKHKASSGTGTEQPPAGNHPAVLVALIDVGTQENEYQGVTNWQHRAFFCWELVTEKMTGPQGANHVIGKDLTLSMNAKSKLRGYVESWRGKKLADDEEFDIQKLLGAKCLLTVTHNAKGYAQIDGVGAVPKGMTVPAAKRPNFLFELSDDPELGAIPAWVPKLYGESIAEHIGRCRELTGKGEPAIAGATNAPASSAAEADETPF